MPKTGKMPERLLYAVFPKRCAICGKVITPNIGCCTVCKKDLPRVQLPICKMCGRGKDECLCRNYRYYYAGLAAPFYYEGNLGNSIRRFKFSGKAENAGFFAEEMADTVASQFAGVSFDMIACVPLSRKSLRERGYNQSYLLAKEIGKQLQIAVIGDLLVKLYDTPAQHTMTSSMRRGNLAGVFDVSNPPAVLGKTVLLCDDIATTGSTINECAKILLLYGAKKVYCVTAAVTRKLK